LPIARDLSTEAIRVNTILPGLFNTPLLAGLPDNVKSALSATVLNPKRLGDPSEYASLALQMIQNGYFNGETVRLDGGIRMAPAWRRAKQSPIAARMRGSLAILEGEWRNAAVRFTPAETAPIFQDLIARHSEAQRRYHGVSHLTALCELMSRHAPHIPPGQAP